MKSSPIKSPASSNNFQVDAFWRWYGELHLTFRSHARAIRFLPHSGNYLTRFSGQSSEFLDYTDYQIGDDPRMLSPRVFARTRRWFVKRMHHRSPIRATIVLDGTSSMFYGGTPEHPESQKWVQQCRVACFFVKDLLNAGDKCQVLVRGNRGEAWFHIRSQRDLHFLLDSLSRWSPDTDIELVENISARRWGALIVLCGDFLFEDDLEFIRLTLPRMRDHRICVIEILHPDEVQGAVETPVIVRDMEGRGIQTCVSLADLEAYQDARKAHRKHLEAVLRSIPTHMTLVEHHRPDNMTHTILGLLRWGEL